jgi:uncharacterized membrane protein YfcA
MSGDVSFAWLLVAGVVAGGIGSAGGITSLVSYPALLVTGLSPIAANIANLVAVVACWPGSALVSGVELTGSGRWLVRTLPAAAIGALIGAGLLLLTPAASFTHIVPFLVIAGSLAVLLQPVLTNRGAVRHDPRSKTALVGIIALSVYSGYFGAGSGVLLLAWLSLLVEPRLPVANALKNMLIGAAGIASAVLFAVAGPIQWTAVLPLALGEFGGSLLGPLAARHLPPTLVRSAIAALGLGLAIELWLRG